MVHALGLDERPVARWQERAGAHGQKVHEDQVMQATRDLTHVHANERRGKGWTMIPWMAMMVSTRLWLGGVVSLRRDRHLAESVVMMVNACGQPLVAVVVVTDGWAASPGSLTRACRDKVKRVTGRGAADCTRGPTS
jgi:hypothetical protein